MIVEGSFLRGNAKWVERLAVKLLTARIPDDLCAVGMTA